MYYSSIIVAVNIILSTDQTGVAEVVPERKITT